MSDGSFCSGTLIGRQAVLTAAHCIGSVTAFYIGKGVSAASTAAAAHPARLMRRWLIIAPRKSEISSDVARIGSTNTRVPVPNAIASNTKRVS